MKYAILTFGCRVNQADSLEFEQDLLTRGNEPASPDVADLVVVNTCSVTATADQGARQSIRRIARSNPAAKIVVTGCYATRCEADVSALPSVVRVIRNGDKERLVESLDLDAGMTTAGRFGEGDGSCGSRIEPGVMGRTAYTLRVQTGCEERCSYCIIPATRGKSRSRPLVQVLEEVARVAAVGFKEIVLTGVHLGSWGRDLSRPSVLADLLRALGQTPGDLLFRVSSLEPMDCTAEIVELIAGSERFAPHLHLPLQQASDRVLRSMRRPYALDDFRELVDGIRARLPHAAIGSDVIVGFPGETASDFSLNADYLTDAPLTHLHVFPYSDRPGTEASRLPAKVHGEDIRARAAAIRAIGSRLTGRFHDAQVGTVRRALTIDDGTLAVTDNYLKVRIPRGQPRNEWIKVRITGADGGLSAVLA